MPKQPKWRTNYPSRVNVLHDDYTVQIVLPVLSPSGNEMQRDSGRWLRRAIKRFALEYIASQFDRWLLRIRPPKGKRRVTFISFRGKLLDDDNLATGLKPIRDVLQKECRIGRKKVSGLGLIHNDSLTWAEFVYRQVVVPECARRVEIIVEGMEEEK